MPPEQQGQRCVAKWNDHKEQMMKQRKRHIAPTHARLAQEGSLDAEKAMEKPLR